MLKQSKAHTNLPANWQGRRPDYSLLVTQRAALDARLNASLQRIQAQNCKTIARLQSVWETCRQRSIQ